MCDRCLNTGILGSNTKSHASKSCPIMAAAHCGYCFIWGAHFSKDCPYKPKPNSSLIEHIPNTKVENPSPCRILADDGVTFIKILSLYGIETKDSTKENRELVEELYKKRGTPVIFANQTKPIAQGKKLLRK